MISGIARKLYQGWDRFISTPRLRRGRHNRSRFERHQSVRERTRRLRQVAAGQLEMAGVTEARKTINHFTGYGGNLERLARRDAA